MERQDKAHIVADVVKKAGGAIDGRIKLQKVIYILEKAGFVSGFDYEYRHYGPYSEELAEAALTAQLVCTLQEEQMRTPWGATYSRYTTEETEEGDTEEIRLIRAANAESSMVLELAATALFLHEENPDGSIDPWVETRDRKPDKAENGRLQKACALYKKLREIVGDRLPALPACPI